MSLAVCAASGKTTTIIAGVNSSPAEVERGNNEHLRVFALTAARTKATQESQLPYSIAEVTRTALFANTEPESYQRIVRLSKSFAKHKQLGIVATGLAKKAEIVVFDPASKPPSSRGSIESSAEANDADILQTGVDEYRIAYCTNHEIFTKTVSAAETSTGPACVYVMPGLSEQGVARPRLPTLRAMRWLSKDFLCVVSNLHGQAGVAVQIFRLPVEKGAMCKLSQSLRLSSRITKATALAVANLTPSLSPADEQGNTQFVLAVAGHDSSISLFKVDLQRASGIYLPSNIKLFRTLQAVHSLQISSLAFSNFQPPEMPITASTPAQTIKLASTGLGNSIVVHTLPLFPLPLQVSSGKSTRPRYVVALPSSSIVNGAGLLGTIFLVGIFAFFLQTALELRGHTDNWVNAVDWTPGFVQSYLAPQMPAGYDALGTSNIMGDAAEGHSGTVNEADTPAMKRPPPEQLAIFDHLRSKDNGNDDNDKLVFIQEEVSPHETNPELVGESRLKAVLVDRPAGASSDAGSTWDQLTREQRESWKAKLREAGHWVEEMGESVFKGVVFGQMGGLVGQAVAAGMA